MSALSKRLSVDSLAKKVRSSVNTDRLETEFWKSHDEERGKRGPRTSKVNISGKRLSRRGLKLGR